MIPQIPPKKEYIITEAHIVAAENNLFSFRERKKEWAAEIRSRLYIPPHPNHSSAHKIRRQL